MAVHVIVFLKIWWQSATGASESHLYEANHRTRQQKVTWVDTVIEDNGGRRKYVERRQFSYTFHIPERRGGPDRRGNDDRRQVPRNGNGRPDKAN